LRQTPTCPYTGSTPPDLFEATSLRLQRISRPPNLRTSIPPRLHAYSASPEFPIS